MKRHYIFLITIGIVFSALAVLFIAFPRSTFSELERRELKTFPNFDLNKLADGSYTADISSWFSDSQPYRDKFLAASMKLKDCLALNLAGDDNITFHDSDDPAGDMSPAAKAEPTEKELENQNREIGEVSNGVKRDQESKVAKAGILIVGKAPTARALMNYGGEGTGGKWFADVMNLYQSKFGPETQVYCMVVPTAMEFYCPDKARETSKRIKPQLPTIRTIYSNLDKGVKAVDVYTPLGQHAAEDIYLRTDHHWAPLGAYYAARKLAEVAKVPFRDLKEYNRHVIHNFVGTMYGYSKDISIKESPEDFVYYTPKDTAYTTTYINFALDKEFKIASQGHPVKGNFFYKYNDGSGMAYSTFMGGDSKIVKVETSTKNGRRLAIIKDSFGNAVPGYMFGSFEEVHVLDYRYFPKNIVKYVKDNKITDFCFINNIFNAYTPSVSESYKKLLNN